MSDAINSIDTAALGSPGCASYGYTERSIEPFMRDVFDQFSETNTGGAFTFMTGIGGFLQEFLYGYSGLRMYAHSVALDPSLTAQLAGVVLHRIAWQGRRFTVSVGTAATTVTLDSGPAMDIAVRGKNHPLLAGHPLTVRTRRPDLTSTPDAVRCARVRASSAQRGDPPLAAVDGSPATGWQPSSVPSRLTASLVQARSVSHATLRWGQMWPPAPAPNVPPPPGPVHTLRPSAYDLLVSADGRTWHVVSRVRDTSNRTTDRLSFASVAARYVRVHILASQGKATPVLDVLDVRR
jgi:hypothetical protein